MEHLKSHMQLAHRLARKRHKDIYYTKLSVYRYQLETTCGSGMKIE